MKTEPNNKTEILVFKVFIKLYLNKTVQPQGTFSFSIHIKFLLGAIKLSHAPSYKSLICIPADTFSALTTWAYFQVL